MFARSRIGPQRCCLLRLENLQKWSFVVVFVDAAACAFAFFAANAACRVAEISATNSGEIDVPAVLGPNWHPFYEPHIAIEVFVERYTSTRLSPITLYFFSCVYIKDGAMLPWLPTVFDL